MIEIRATDAYSNWIASLRDPVARRAIASRLLRIESGLFGDVKPIGDGLSELRVDVGPGYRVYFGRRGAVLVILLGGGDKSTQSRDIKRARELWKTLED
jgi:putative addiction module killer protein